MRLKSDQLEILLIVGVLRIQDICHFTSRNMSYYPFFLLSVIWNRVINIFVYFQEYRMFWKFDLGDICQFIAILAC